MNVQRSLFKIAKKYKQKKRENVNINSDDPNIEVSRCQKSRNSKIKNHQNQNFTSLAK